MVGACGRDRLCSLRVGDIFDKGLMYKVVVTFSVRALKLPWIYYVGEDTAVGKYEHMFNCQANSSTISGKRLMSSHTRAFSTPAETPYYVSPQERTGCLIIARQNGKAIVR